MVELVAMYMLGVGLTTVVTRGSIFAGLRDAVSGNFVGSALSCPMCTGFWMGVLAACVAAVVDADVTTLAMLSAPPAVSALSTVFDPVRLWSKI